MLLEYGHMSLETHIDVPYCHFVEMHVKHDQQNFSTRLEVATHFVISIIYFLVSSPFAYRANPLHFSIFEIDPRPPHLFTEVPDRKTYLSMLF